MSIVQEKHSLSNDCARSVLSLVRGSVTLTLFGQGLYPSRGHELKLEWSFDYRCCLPCILKREVRVALHHLPLPRHLSLRSIGRPLPLCST